jgi:uncharacterized protein
MAIDSPTFSNFLGTMKCTLLITQECNLACDYCYIGKKKSVMSLSTAAKIVDFVFAHAASGDKIEIGFFGGEPLLEFGVIKEITDIIQKHRSFGAKRVNISVVTNGTIFSDRIAKFLAEKNIVLCVSCDGPAAVQDIHRRFPDGHGSSAVVEQNLKKALKCFPFIPVNAVYSPEGLRFLPDVVDYLVSLGAVNIYLNPNISAHWTRKEADMLPAVYGLIGKKYVDFYLQGKPKYINLIDGKITVILRGGYKPVEKCLMGQKELAFAPSGNIYPCERLVGSDDGKTHCLGNITEGFDPSKACGGISCAAKNLECRECGLAEYCANWCGCTNFYSTGRYDVVGPFMCASEKAAIGVAYDILELMKGNQQLFAHHLAGTPLVNVISEILSEDHEH